MASIGPGAHRMIGSVLAPPFPASRPIYHWRGQPPIEPETTADTAPEDTVTDTGAPLRCAECRHRITTAASATQMQGGHEHVFTNPHGYRFSIACYREAPGCRGAGEWTDEHTWFAGCQWRYALCGACGAHLGWQYRGTADFFGLIRNQLVL